MRHLCPLNPIQTPELFFDRFKNELSHLCPLNRIQIFKKIIAIPWKWTTECFKTDCGQNLWIEISFFNIFWQTKIEKTFTSSLQYLEHELRHLCLLNPIQTPDFFRSVQKWVEPSMSFKSHSNLRKKTWQYHGNEPLNVLTGCGQNLWIEFMSYNFISGWWMSGDMRELRHLCGHSQPDFGQWVGVEPSVPKRQLDVEKKIWGETSAEDCKKYVIFRDIDGSTALF